MNEGRGEAVAWFKVVDENGEMTKQGATGRLTKPALEGKHAGLQVAGSEGGGGVFTRAVVGLLGLLQAQGICRRRQAADAACVRASMRA